MRREWPVQWIGTPARCEMRLMERVTESGVMPPVMWPPRSLLAGSVRRWAGWNRGASLVSAAIAVTP